MEGEEVVLRILHFNDVYNVGSDAPDSSGVSKHSDRAVRFCLKIEEEINKYPSLPLILFSGDAFSPALISTLTKGKHMMEVLEVVGIHVATFGNHDFDFGIERAKELTQEKTLFEWEKEAQRATSEWVISNILGRNGTPLAGGKRSCIVEREGIKIGILAVSEDWLPDCGLSIESQKDDKHANYQEAIQTAKVVVEELKIQGASVILGLTHSLICLTEEYASKVEGVDFWFGGHEHVYQTGKKWIISGWNFEDFSTIEMTLSKNNNNNNNNNNNQCPIQSITTHRTHIDSSSPLPSLSLLPPRTARMHNLVKHYEKKAEELLKKPVGYLCCGEEEGKEGEEGVDTRKFLLRTRETVGGNLIADIFFDYFSKKGADFCFLIAGVIGGGGDGEVKGEVTYGDITKWFPWEGRAVMVEVGGEMVRECLEWGVRMLPRRFGCFPVVSGLKFEVTVDENAREGERGAPGKRVGRIWVRRREEEGGGWGELEEGKAYKVCMTDYICEGGDGYYFFTQCQGLLSEGACPLIHDVVSQYFLERGGGKGEGEGVRLGKVEGRVRHLKGFETAVEEGEVREVSGSKAKPWKRELYVKPYDGE